MTGKMPAEPPLSEAERYVLSAFHEMAGERAGIRPGAALDSRQLDALELHEPDLDVEEAICALEARGFVERAEEGGFRITDAGAAQLYPAQTSAR